LGFCGDERTLGDPVMTFPIKKRIDTELIVDRKASLFVGETPIRVVTNMGDDRPVSTS